MPFQVEDAHHSGMTHSQQLQPRLWTRDFLAYWLGIALGALGDAFVLVALPYLVLEITGSPGALATVVLLGAIPRFLSPLTGAIADRLNLRLPLILSTTLRAGVFAGLALLAMAGALPTWVIYVAAPFNALLMTFTAAAGMVLLPAMVHRSQLQRANGLLQGAMMGVPLLGLGAAGALVGFLGTATTLLIASPALLALGVAALFIRFPQPEAASGVRSVVTDLLRAGRFLVEHGPLAYLMLLTFALNAALSILSVTVPVRMEVLGAGAGGYGIYQSLLSAGLLGGVVTVTLLGARVLPRLLIGFAQLLIAAGFVVMAGLEYVPLLAGAVIVGLGLGSTEVAAITLLQLAIPAGMRGKVLGLIIMVNAAGLSAGAWVAGLVVGGAGLGPVYAAAAVLLGLLALIWLLLQAGSGGLQLDRLVGEAAATPAKA